MWNLKKRRKKHYFKLTESHWPVERYEMNRKENRKDIIFEEIIVQNFTMSWRKLNSYIQETSTPKVGDM